jgi:hypothetical protein
MQRAGTNNIVGGDPGRSVASMYLLVRILGEEAKTRAQVNYTTMTSPRRLQANKTFAPPIFSWDYSF